MKNLKRFLNAGLLTMTQEAKEAWINRIVQGETIDGAALAALIDSMKTEMTKLLVNHENLVPNPEEIRAMIDSIDGKKEVTNMNAIEIVDLVKSLRVAIGGAAEVGKVINLHYYEML